MKISCWAYHSVLLLHVKELSQWHYLIIEYLNLRKTPPEFTTDEYIHFFQIVGRALPHLHSLSVKEEAVITRLHKYANTFDNSLNVSQHKILKPLHHMLKSSERSEGCFVRLSTRSGKDVAKHDTDKQRCEQHSILKCNNAMDMFKQLVNSNRIQEDMRDKKKNQQLYICIFPWISSIRPDNEYRCFIYQKQLVAVSRMLYDLDEPSKDKKNEIKERIEEFYATYMIYIPYDNCIVDLCVNDDKIIFIEFNPYSKEITDSYLFDWENDSDILFPSRYSSEFEDSDDDELQTVYRYK